jgi:hypothetical protein
MVWWGCVGGMFMYGLLHSTSADLTEILCTETENQRCSELLSLLLVYNEGNVPCTAHFAAKLC